MATMYKKNDTWYLSVSLNYKRITRSLKTKDKSVAIRIKPQMEYDILAELLGNKNKSKQLTKPELFEKYLNTDHGWAKSTRQLNTLIYKKYLNNSPLPSNPTSRAIYVRTINVCWNWGLKNGYISQAYKLTGDSIGESRLRVLSKNELNIILNNVQPLKFQRFITFAYFTGARRGEIARTSSDMIQGESLIVKGKSGIRVIKLTQQAKSFFDEFKYRPDYITHQFKKEARRLGIDNIRFHDLRRTFGYNLIKQGKPIYEVSKLLGHSSVTVTERHYAPLLTTEIEDFTL